jgi:hypothetical protein
MIKKVLLPLVALVLLGGLVLAAVQSRGTGSQDQTIRSRKGTPLQALIPSGVTTVTIEKDQTPSLSVDPPPGMNQLEWITSLSPFVFVLRVESVMPQLTPDGDWITSTVNARIEDVLRSPVNQPHLAGDTIEFIQEGGDMTIAGTVVHAVVSWTYAFQASERYLVFAKLTSSSQWIVSDSDSYKITSLGRIVSLGRESSKATTAARSESNVALAEAIARIRAVKSGKNK